MLPSHFLSGWKRLSVCSNLYLLQWYIYFLLLVFTDALKKPPQLPNDKDMISALSADPNLKKMMKQVMAFVGGVKVLSLDFLHR
jgi:hypothetical protein